MGTIIEKLNYLKETKEELKNLLKLNDVEVNNDTTFREMIGYSKDLINNLGKYYRALRGESWKDMNPYPIDPNETATIEEAPEKYMVDGEAYGIKYTVDCSYYVVAPEDYTNHAGEKLNSEQHKFFIAPPLISSSDPQYFCVLDFSKLKNAMVRIPPTRTQDRYDFVAYNYDYGFGSPNNFAYNKNRGLFRLGLVFGKKFSECTSTFIIQTQLECGFDVPVYVQPEFEGTLYLSKLPMSTETMVNIFNNLADMSENAKKYTLNIGTTNLEKLTEEEKQIAYDKGWELS